jgi:uncharacterized protein
MGDLVFEKLDRFVYAGNIRNMVDLARIEGFDWDEGNSRKSAAKHGVSRPEAEQVFFNRPLLVAGDRKHSKSEQRFHAFGRTDLGRHLHVSFTLRYDETIIRVISARDMGRKERAFYEEESGE